MPWKDRYTISDECGMADHQVVWPQNSACCFRVVVDVSPPCGPAGLTPASVSSPDAHYGLHGGLLRVQQVLRRYKLSATFAVPAVLVEPLAGTLRELIGEGHEIAAHGFLREDVSLLSYEEEARRLERTSNVLMTLTGVRPSGWFSLPRQSDKYAGGAISPHTAGLLLDNGYLYLGNSLADDIPHYWVADFAARQSILALPYYYHFDDQFFLLFPAQGTGLEHPDVLLRNWEAEFDAQYRRGRQFSIVLHPYAIGWPHRLLMLEQFLTRLRDYPRLWNPTSAACASYWLARFPASQTLHLEASIWQDYEGSLS